MDSIGVSTVIENIDYRQYPNRKLLALPLGLFALALCILGVAWVLTGSPIALGVEFVGGSELRLAADDVDGDPETVIHEAFDSEPDSIQTVPADGTYIVTFKDGDTGIEEFEQAAEGVGFDIRSSSEISPTFGGETQSLALQGILFAFLGMSLVIFALFRTFVPSTCVVASAVSDLIIPLAMMQVVGIDLTLGTVAALLMLIGYSVDSDVLLNDYVIRRSGSFYESVYNAMDTGITMTLTSFLAMTVMAISATIFGVGLLRDIGLILAFGLLVDLMNTYMMNFSILRWYKFEGVNR